MNLPYIGQMKGLRQFLIEEHILSPIEVGLASDEDLIDTVLKKGFLLGILFYYIIENNNDNDFTPA